MKLYSYWRSSCSYRVRIALALKGVDYEYVAVHLRDGEQRGEDFASRNALGQVPLLEWEDEGEVHQLSQSLAICEWLDVRFFPGQRLYPEDGEARARVVELAEIINAGIQPMQNLRLLNTLKELGVDPAAWSAEHIERGFVALEAAMAQRAGAYAVGDEVSVADVCLVPQMYNARRFSVDLAPFPTLTRVDAACCELSAFADAHPDRQPDAQG